jgi:hypothetical protein
MLDGYRQHTAQTDPAEYAPLYDGLPTSLEDLCTLIKQQLMHPLEQGPLRDSLPEDRVFEDVKYRDVRSMLEGLLALNSDGLVIGRLPAERLMVGCWHHALLLSSILRERGVPVRLRCGYAPYIAPGTDLHVGHVICEVWEAEAARWILVDPDRRRVDFARSEFEFPAATWLAVSGEQFDSQNYRAAHLRGLQAILLILHLDHRSIVPSESPYWDLPAIVNEDLADLDDIGDERLGVLDRIASLLSDPDQHLSELGNLLTDHEYFRNEERVEEH